MNSETFIKELKKIKIELSNYQLEQLEMYCELLAEENKKYNLTAITKKEEVYLKHFYDSLTINKIINLTNQSLCDIGSGAGFPGIVLKIAYPSIKLTLIESSKKKCKFLQMLTEKLSLKDVKILNARVEEYGRNNRELFDIVTSRAVANLKILLELATPLLKTNGYFIPLKGNIDDEIRNINEYYVKLSLKQIQIEKFNLPIENSCRTIIKYQKISKTNIKYPRKYNEIIKKII